MELLLKGLLCLTILHHTSGFVSPYDDINNSDMDEIIKDLLPSLLPPHMLKILPYIEAVHQLHQLKKNEQCLTKSKGIPFPVSNESQKPQNTVPSYPTVQPNYPVPPKNLTPQREYPTNYPSQKPQTSPCYSRQSRTRSIPTRPSKNSCVCPTVSSH